MRRPGPVRVVDEEDMPVPCALGGVIAQVRMIFRKVRMLVLDHLRVIRRPGPERQQPTAEADRAQHRHGRRQPEPAAGPAGNRIGQQPAQMRQGELRRKQRRPVLGMGRVAQQPPRRRLRPQMTSSIPQSGSPRVTW